MIYDEEKNLELESLYLFGHAMAGQINRRNNIQEINDLPNPFDFFSPNS